MADVALSSVVRTFFVADTTKTDGSGLTGKAYSDFTAYYWTRGGGGAGAYTARTALTTVSVATQGTYSAPADNGKVGIKEIADGFYEAHFHNDCVAPTNVVLYFEPIVTGGKCVPIRIDLLPYHSDVQLWLASTAPAIGTQQTGDAYAVVAGTAGSAAAYNILTASTGTVAQYNILAKLGFTGSGPYYVKADITYVDGAACHSATAGRLAANLATMFDVATQNFTGASVNQTADGGAASTTTGTASYTTLVNAAYGLNALLTAINTRSTLAAGAAMTLTSAYDAAKTAVSQGHIDGLIPEAIPFTSHKVDANATIDSGGITVSNVTLAPGQTVDANVVQWLGHTPTVVPTTTYVDSASGGSVGPSFGR